MPGSQMEAPRRPWSLLRNDALRRPAPTGPDATSRAPGRPIPAASTTADALSRIAAKVSGRRDVNGLFEDVIDEAFGLFGVDRAGLWLYDQTARDAALARRPPGPVGRDHRSHQRAATRRPDDRHGRDPPPPRPRARPRHAHHDPRAPGGLPLHRRPKRVLRAARVRRRAARPARALPPRGLRLDARRTRAGPGLRRPDGHGDRRRPAGRFAPDPRGSAHVDRGAHRQAQPAARPGGHRVGDRRGSQATLRPRHDPRLSRRSRDRDVRATRVRGDVPRDHEARPSRPCASRSARASRAGSRSTAARSGSATPRGTRAGGSSGPRTSRNRS